MCLESMFGIEEWRRGDVVKIYWYIGVNCGDQGEGFRCNSMSNGESWKVSE